MLTRMSSLLELAGLPREFGITLLGLTLVLTLVPYFAGHDFGVLKAPELHWRRRRFLRIAGPVSLLLVVLAHLPLVSKTNPLPNSVAISPFTSIAPNQPELVSLANMLTIEMATNLAADGALRVASTRSTRLLSEKEHTVRLAAELNVAAVIEGSLNLSDGRVLTVWPSIVSASHGFAVWTRQYCSSDAFNRESLARLAARMASDVRERLLTSDSQAIVKGLRSPDDSGCKTEAKKRPTVSLSPTFRHGTAYLDESGYAFIATLATALQHERLSKKTFLIEGHVRRTDVKQQDVLLSEARALSIKAALVANGVEANRLVVGGKGSVEPFSTDPLNTDADNRITISTLERP